MLSETLTRFHQATEQVLRLLISLYPLTESRFLDG